MKTIATIETKVLYIQSTTSGTFYILQPIANGLKKLGITGTEFNEIPEIQSDGSEGSSATCPTVKVCRNNRLLVVPGRFGNVIHETQPDKDIVVTIFIQEREGLEKLGGKYHFAAVKR